MIKTRKIFGVIFVFLVIAFFGEALSMAEEGAGLYEKLKSTLEDLRAVRAKIYEERAAWLVEKESLQSRMETLESEDRWLGETLVKLQAERAELALLEKTRLSELEDAKKEMSQTHNSLDEAWAFLSKVSEERPDAAKSSLAEKLKEVKPQSVLDENADYSSQFVSLWRLYEEELAYGASCTVIDASVEIEGRGRFSGNLLSLGSALFYFVSRDGGTAAIYESGKWIAAESGEMTKNIRAAVEILSRKRLPEILLIPAGTGGVK